MNKVAKIAHWQLLRISKSLVKNSPHFDVVNRSTELRKKIIINIQSKFYKLYIIKNLGNKKNNAFELQCICLRVWKT